MCVMIIPGILHGQNGKSSPYLCHPLAWAFITASGLGDGVGNERDPGGIPSCFRGAVIFVHFLNLSTSVSSSEIRGGRLAHHVGLSSGFSGGHFYTKCLVLVSHSINVQDMITLVTVARLSCTCCFPTSAC